MYETTTSVKTLKLTERSISLYLQEFSIEQETHQMQSLGGTRRTVLGRQMGQGTVLLSDLNDSKGVLHYLTMGEPCEIVLGNSLVYRAEVRSHSVIMDGNFITVGVDFGVVTRVVYEAPKLPDVMRSLIIG